MRVRARRGARPPAARDEIDELFLGAMSAVRPGPPRRDLTGMVNPYRVLAFAVESGDRRLTTLLTARLFRPAPASNAAWRTFSRLVAALDLG